MAIVCQPLTLFCPLLKKAIAKALEKRLLKFLDVMHFLAFSICAQMER